jgi:tRNA1Val (adenine37-N6)-methyltransferase
VQGLSGKKFMSAMPNNYFQFRQFKVQQDKCAMKVCTDACLFGAWAADYLHNKNCSDVLDIGAGTGLLSLMLSQKTTAYIDSAEIDSNAFLQAKENFESSNWKERLQIFNTDICDFNPGKKYDFIISNPPFFENDLKSLQQNKNAAKHDTALNLVSLAQIVKKLLSPAGHFAVLLPHLRTSYFINEAKKQGLYCNETVLVKQTAGHTYFRSMLLFSLLETAGSEREIIIKDTTGNYTEAFSGLLKDYYLYL